MCALLPGEARENPAHSMGHDLVRLLTARASAWVLPRLDSVHRLRGGDVGWGSAGLGVTEKQRQQVKAEAGGGGLVALDGPPGLCEGEVEQRVERPRVS